MRLLVLILISIFSLPSLAEKLSSPLVLSQGSAGGASLKEDFSYVINPATVGFQRRTKGAIAYSFKQKQKTVLVSFLDRKTNLPLAFTYQRFWSNSLKKPDKQTLLFSSGLQLSSFFSLGLTVEKEVKKPNWNGSVGSLLVLGEQLSIAFFMDQLLKIDDQDQKIMSLALYYNWKEFFSTKVDVSRTAQKEWIFKGGLESLFQNFLSIRLGGIWAYKKQKGWVSGGLAFYSPRLLLEYSLETDHKNYQHAVVLNLYI